MIDKDFILFGIEASTQKEAIQALVEHSAVQGRVADTPKVIQAVLEREQEGTTGFGKGIAIPHGKSSGVTKPTLMFGGLNQKVDWNSMDDQPVDKLFLILVPETSHQEHLQMLAKLARKLMHDEFVDALNEIHAPEQMAVFLKEELA